MVPSLQSSSTLLAVESAAGVCKPDEAPPPPPPLPPRSADAVGEGEGEEVGTEEQIGMLVPLHFGREEEREKEGRARESRAGSVKPCKVQGRVLPTRRRRRREECVGRGRKEFCVSNL